MQDRYLGHRWPSLYILSSPIIPSTFPPQARKRIIFGVCFLEILKTTYMHNEIEIFSEKESFCKRMKSGPFLLT
jgi:hypothetical protein